MFSNYHNAFLLLLHVCKFYLIKSTTVATILKCFFLFSRRLSGKAWMVHMYSILLQLLLAQQKWQTHTHRCNATWTIDSNIRETYTSTYLSTYLNSCTQSRGQALHPIFHSEIKGVWQEIFERKSGAFTIKRNGVSLVYLVWAVTTALDVPQGRLTVLYFFSAEKLCHWCITTQIYANNELNVWKNVSTTAVPDLLSTLPR